MSRQIKIKVDPKGQVTISAEGYKGSACHDATRALEEAMGERGSSRDTDEAFEQEGEGVEVRT